MKLQKFWAWVSVAVMVLGSGMATAGTLDDVKAKGFVQVGVNGQLAGFGIPDEKGEWKGLDVDTGRAIAAAVFGDAQKNQVCSADRCSALHGASIRRSGCSVP